MGHVGLAVAGAACGGQPLRHRVSDKVPPRVDFFFDTKQPPVDRGHPDTVPLGGRAFAVGGGERRALLSGDVEEGVEDEVSDTFPQGGSLDKRGRQDG